MTLLERYKKSNYLLKNLVLKHLYMSLIFQEAQYNVPLLIGKIGKLLFSQPRHSDLHYYHRRTDFPLPDHGYGTLIVQCIMLP